MSNSDRLFWVLIGVLIGIAIGMILASRPPSPVPDNTNAAQNEWRKPMATKRAAS